MLIGLEFAGAFGNAPDWTIATVRAVTAKAEEAGISFLLVPDAIADLHGGNAWPDATILLGWLAASTQRIGLIALTSTVGHQPYNLARRLGSLDMLSHGRIGWCLTTVNEAAEEAAFSGTIRLPNGNTPDRIAEFVAVVEGLSHGWDADALVIDKTSGQFIDPAKMHMLDHQGTFFSVRGPLNIMRSPQDRPVLAVAAGDAKGLGTVADLADIVISDGMDLGHTARKAFRRIDAPSFLSQISEQDPTTADRLVITVHSAEEADAVLAALPTLPASDHTHFITLRQRLEGATR